MSNCYNVSDLSPLCRLTRLRKLSLSYCSSVSLFDPIKSLVYHLDDLRLADCRFHDLPVEVCGTDWKVNVRDGVVAYYADLDAGAATDAEVKLFVLGNGTVGKTQLARRLCGQPFDETIPSTHGVQLRRFPADDPDRGPVTVNLWDFGGQDIYHSSHALFLQRQAVFVLLWTPDHETGTTTEAEFTMRNRPLAYWFDYLRSAVGERRDDGTVVVDAPVLVVQSRCERKQDERRTPPALPSQEEFPNLSVLAFGAKNDHGIRPLRAALTDAIATLFADRPRPPMGIGRVAVRERLRAMQAEPEATRTRTLSRDEFAALCTEIGNVSNPDALLQFFHRTGVVFHQKGMFGGQVVVDQTWALDAIYSVFHRRDDLQAELRRAEGRFTRATLDAHVWGHVREREVPPQRPFTPAEQDLFLGMMIQCRIAFRTRQLDGTQKWKWEYTAPDRLPAWGDGTNRIYASLLGQPRNVAVRLDHAFLHDGIPRGFLAAVGKMAGDRAGYWRYGCHLYDRDTDSTAVVRFEERPTADRPAAGSALLEAWGRDARGLLRKLVRMLTDAPTGLPPDLDPPDFFGARSEPDRHSPGQPIDPDRLKNTVYVSYSHDPESRAVTAGLVAALQSVKVDVLWDESNLRDGDSISAFVTLVRAVPVLIAVVGRDYLRKRWCVSELHGFFEACRSDQGEFARRAMAIVLPGVRLDHPDDRAPHAGRWRAEADRYRALPGATGEVHTAAEEMTIWAARLPRVLEALSDAVADRQGPPIGDFQRTVNVARDRLAGPGTGG